MREDVLSLRAMGGDPVSEEYLKADLYHRAEALQDIPDTPLFFGRLDYASQHGPTPPNPDNPEPDNPELEIPEPEYPEPDNPEPDNPELEIPELEYPELDRPTTASRGTAFTSAADTCTRRTARPP